MLKIRSISRQLLFAVVLTGLAAPGCGRVQGDEETPAPPGGALTEEETRLVRQAAEEKLKLSDSSSTPLDRLYFIKIDVLPASPEEPGRRLVNVIHYRYKGDETIITLVAVNTLDVLKVEVIPHFPTALAP